MGSFSDQHPEPSRALPYKQIVRTLDPPKHDGIVRARIIISDWSPKAQWIWDTWEKIGPELEPTTPTFVIQMPTGRTDSACLRVVPNPYEVYGVDDAETRDALRQQHPPAFAERRPQMFYRGTNHPLGSWINCHGAPPVIKGGRVVGQTVCTTSRHIVFEMGADQSNWDFLNATLGGASKHTFGEYRYLLDIGGVDGTTWEKIRWKMALGSLVFKVDSDRYTWFHTLVRPHVHYIPVKADLSDLRAQYEWAINHPEDAERIAKAGQKVAISLNTAQFCRITWEIITKTIDECAAIAKDNMVVKESSFEGIWHQSNLGRMAFSWDANAPPHWTTDVIGSFHPVVTSRCAPSHGCAFDGWDNKTIAYEMIIGMLNLPKHDVSARIILNDVETWDTWDKIPPELEPTTPTFVIQMPTGRTESVCLRIVPNPHEVDGTDDFYEFPYPGKRRRAPVFAERRPQVFYRGKLQPSQNKTSQHIVFGMGADPANLDWLDAKSISAERHEFGTCRYLLDIGGVDGTTWGSLRWKMALGSLVFKVESDRYTWFHTLVRPHVHYIPVKADLSDLRAQYEWAINHPADAERIAKAGQKAATSMNRNVFRRITKEIIAKTINECEMYNHTTEAAIV
ncbi:hypothetical protein PPROV_000672500 [Pycnococcus provasolii]|uniref:Glycosyl transferase CAP10 domain-containing protein n=1 Tax=Pycnococcus provasolii TaxID=41880 RepID=A0A830HMR3_9CHLO|nr:hypothetical protein PPROV_000672500 [Pycnococcus provasolii]